MDSNVPQVIRLIEDYYGSELITPHRFGAKGDGVTDDTSAFSAAFSSLGPDGGVVTFKGIFLIDSNLTIPDGCTLKGFMPSVGQINSAAYTAANFVSMLIVNGSKTITMRHRTCVQDCLIIEKNISPLGTYPLPFANAPTATFAVAAFSGNLFTPLAGTTIDDIRLENLLCLGFEYLFNGLSAAGLNRPLFRRVYGDCTNGIHVTNVFDIGKCEDCHMWEFTTTNQAFTTDALITRTGVAFYAGPGSVWFTWFNCFEYGWAIGYDVNGIQDSRLMMCGADGPATGTTKGFRLRGSMANAWLIGCTGTQQTDCVVEVNPSVQNNVNDVKIVALTGHGNNSANGYVNVLQGTCSIQSSFFSDNSSVGHIKLATGAILSNVSDCTFANLGAATPIFGDATAVRLATARLINPTYAGNTSPGQPLNWTPDPLVNGVNTGITLSVHTGQYTVKDDLVTASFQLIFTSKGVQVGTFEIAGLPFAAKTAKLAGGLSYYNLNMAGLTSVPLFLTQTAATKFSVYQQGATGIALVTNANITDTTVLYGTVTYVRE